MWPINSKDVKFRHSILEQGEGNQEVMGWEVSKHRVG